MRRAAALSAVLAILVPSSFGQSPLAWKRVAGTTTDEGLAGMASGPVQAVWYAPGTGRLLAQTMAGRIFETSDFVHWRLNTIDAVPLRDLEPGVLSLPEAGAGVQVAGSRLYAIGSGNLYVSTDRGRQWLNLTGFNGISVIGGGFAAVAVSPVNPQEITAANQFGLWRSLDGGISWSGLNDDLPNFPVRRLLGRRSVLLANGSAFTVKAGVWAGTGPAASRVTEAGLIARFSAAARTAFTAAVQTGDLAYAGTQDGKLLSSRDGGATWAESPAVPGVSRIDRLWQDSDRPEVALAAAGGKLLRTINGGLFWDDVTGALPDARIHGLTADRSAGVVYVATDRGVFSGSLSLNDAGPAAANWVSISRDLPAAAAWDVMLNADNTLTVALDGYGVFETPAPHRSRNVRIVNGADMSDRAAAPGSLISVLGANISMVRAGSVSYPVIAASDQSSQLQVPFEAASGTYSLALEAAGERWTAPLTVKDAAPAIFVDAEGAPLILDAASGLVLDPNVGVRAASTVQLLATGLGKVSPEWPTGIPAPLDSPPAVNATVTAFLDGTPVHVTKATLAPGYVGYYVVELQIPAIINRGASELRIVMNGEESNRVKLYLEPDLAQ
ncbi:MAG TPA: hypothetical protein VG273_24965 [Bryobacteraceae bacterium]|jgi:uncharacterized protein (TIGR03437 family)|nr:hypothetical protein [Bryobacteraceae bacterium]